MQLRGARPVQQAQRDPTRDTRAHNVNQVPGPNPGPHHPPAAALNFPANANALAATALAATGIITSTIAFTGGQQAQVQAQAQQPPIISPQAIRFIANAAAGHQGLADALNTFASLNNRAVAAAYINNSAATNGVVDRSLRHFGFLNNVAAHFQQAANPNDPRSVELRAAAFLLGPASGEAGARFASLFKREEWFRLKALNRQAGNAPWPNWDPFRDAVNLAYPAPGRCLQVSARSVDRSPILDILSISTNAYRSNVGTCSDRLYSTHRLRIIW
ncbi:hypothetical protein OHC33_002579 [Knufia fluminis]|uniref:Uncharacterized protein n=1 Tax=Knufia fluminis TaxID=191047 RepID=A0AAN8FCX6_9EURO|nr:hypothetical protein OHC33_002579 [Knufia fluminis]